jgi:hypothetical protein
MIDSDSVTKNPDLLVQELYKEYEELLKKYLSRIKDNNSKNKFLFLLGNEIPYLFKFIYNKRKVDYKPKKLPNNMYSFVQEKLEDGTKIMGKYSQRSAPYFDHLGDIPNSILGTQKYPRNVVFTSNPYLLDMNQLDALIKDMNKQEMTFIISGESNYLPGRSFQIRFIKNK